MDKSTISDGEAARVLHEAELQLTQIQALIEASNPHAAIALSHEAEAAFARLGRADRVMAAKQRRMMGLALVERLDEAMAGNQALADDFLAAGDEVRSAQVRTNLGFNFQQAGDLTAAAREFRGAARIFRRHFDRQYELATTYMNLAAVLTATRPRASVAYAEKAVALFQAQGHQVKVADSNLLLARHADREGQLEMANALRREAKVIYERKSDPVRAAHVEYLTGSAAGRHGMFDEAVSHLSDALAVFLEVGAPTQVELADCARRLALAHRERGDTEMAWGFSVLAVLVLNGVRSRLRPATVRAAWRLRRGSTYALAIRLALDLGDDDAALVLIEHARAQQAPASAARTSESAAAADAPTLRPSTADTIVVGRADRTRESRHVGLIESLPLPRFTLAGKDPLDSDNLVTRVAASIGALANGVAFRFAVPEHAVDLDELSADLAGTTSNWWSSVVVDDELFWAVRTNRRTSAGGVAIPPDGAISTTARHLSELLVGSDEVAPVGPSSDTHWRRGGDVERLVGQLTDIVPQIVRDAAAAATADNPIKVVYSPAPEFAHVPMPIVPIDGTGRRLLHGAAMLLCPSPALVGLRKGRRAGGPSSVSTSASDRAVTSAVSDPTGDLPSVRVLVPRSVDQIGTSVSPWPLRRRPAGTRDNLSALLMRHADDRQGVFVYAGHSTPGPIDDPLGAHLSLQDGPLTAREMLDANGRSEFPLPARVMFASCSSAGLAHQDWAGLAAASSWLGAETALATLWPIPSGRQAVQADQAMLEAFRRPDPIAAIHDLQLRSLTAWENSAPNRLVGWSARGRSDMRFLLAYVLIAL
jgi:tetratricopeptide (TPR) repeat protein